jgi:hypothetical protein
VHVSSQAMSTLIVSAEIQHTHSPEAKFLDVFGDKSLESLYTLYTETSLRTLKIMSRNFYVHEFGFRLVILFAS